MQRSPLTTPKKIGEPVPNLIVYFLLHIKPQLNFSQAKGDVLIYEKVHFDAAPIFNPEIKHSEP